jgi:parallel beta-helix repeat protein
MPDQQLDMPATFPTDRRALLAGIGGLAAGTFLAAGRAEAGPLNPPAAPASTPGPEPRIAINATNTPGNASHSFRITQSGSYYLTGNILGQSGRNGISINANNVTIDLMGYAVVGVAGSLSGIVNEQARYNITVRNGSISGWGGDGIKFSSAVTFATYLVEQITSYGNTGNGISVAPNTVVRGCVTRANGIAGIATGPACSITECSAHSNATGFAVGTGCTIANCVASNNTGVGFDASSGNAITGCCAQFNSTGIIVGASSAISNCTMRANDIDGLSTGGNCLIVDCFANFNDANGIACGSNSLVTSCAASFNLAAGVSLTNGSKVLNCTVSNNSTDGIVCGNRCVIEGNACDANGSTAGNAAGIHVTGTNNRIEGNTCTNNTRGVDVDGGSNIITRNMCAGNTTNWDIAGGNHILVISAASTVAFTGNDGGATIGTNNAWANYTY